MSKIAGLRGRSPETYATRRESGDVQTITDSSAGAVGLSNGSFTDLIAPIALPGAGGFRAIVMYSGVLETPAPGPVTVEAQIVVGGDNVYTQLIQVNAASSPVSFSMVFETEFLGAGPPGVFVRAMTTNVGDTANSVDASVVVIATPT